MDVSSFLRDPVSRRRFFHRSGIGVAGSGAVLLTACGDDDGTTDGDSGEGGSVSNEEADAEILNGALDLEWMAIAAYKSGAGRLRGTGLDAVQTFLEHEQEHVDGLKNAIKELGGRPNGSKAVYDFPELRSQEDVLRFAVDLENTAIAAYIDALPKLSAGELRGTAASILTNEAEHVSVLLGELGEEPVPEAFVVGKPGGGGE